MLPATLTKEAAPDFDIMPKALHPPGSLEAELRIVAQSNSPPETATAANIDHVKTTGYQDPSFYRFDHDEIH